MILVVWKYYALVFKKIDWNLQLEKMRNSLTQLVEILGSNDNIFYIDRRTVD